MKHRKHLFLALLFVILTTLIVCIFMAMGMMSTATDTDIAMAMDTGTAPQTTIVRISPQTLNIRSGHSFSVNITVEPNTPIAGVQLNLLFNCSLLTVNSVTEGNLFKQAGASTYFNPGTIVINNSIGTIKHVHGCIITAGENVSTPGTFAIINFSASNITTGTSLLSFVDLPPIHVKVTDPEGEPIPISIENGTIRVVNEMPITVFDTHYGGYPSIMGTHFGNITPFHNLTVSRLYTYSCPGTSGHSEHIVFYDYENDEKIAEANWSGYQPFTDYHYIIFNTPLLYAGKTYRYQIKTGSYPQIHHNQSIVTPDGILTCTKFIDTNGKVYNDWIPAIRLEYCAKC